MTVAAPSTGVAISAAGPVAGAAWLTPAGTTTELAVYGKLSIQLGRDGNTSMVTLPERPGWNQGRAAREETEPSQARRLIVRGHRTQPGRVVLRRGAEVLGEVTFSAGVEPVATDLPSTMQTTIGSRRGDDYLVVEGVEGPQARRWCKLPKLGVLVTWDEVERLLLTSRACLVDVSSWTIAFLMSSSRKFLPAMAPSHLSMVVMDLAAANASPAQQVASAIAALSPGGIPPPAPSPLPRPAPPKPPITDEESSTATGHTRQVNPNELARLLSTVAKPALDDGNDDGPTKILPNADLLRLQSETADPATVDPDPPTISPPAPAEPPPPVVIAKVADPPTVDVSEPGEITRAFSKLTVDALPSLRTEVERRLKAGASLAGLDLRRASLGGLRARGAKLVDADLSEADLSAADFTSADLTGAKLDGAKLDAAHLDEACLSNATFECATMCGASLRHANLTGASFAGADLRRADVRGAAPGHSLMGANLDGAQFG